MFKYLCRSTCGLDLSTRNSTIINKNWQKKVFNYFDVNDFRSFVQPLKRISYWKCFHNYGCLQVKHLHWLTGIPVFASDEPLNSREHKGGVESNRLSTCVESTMMMSRNDFNLCRIDLYRNDRTPFRVTLVHGVTFLKKWISTLRRSCFRTTRLDHDESFAKNCSSM